ncbi:filamentous hemagglutinin N-terminal domain-containing protein [Neptuniibacter sp. SY11_33]|uniref:two-partner secretion domain-containing protein n=1 Tax=Neptuniibacter sp. SY11_33 TaxID=3398215 RepID=UPI0039F59852
MNWSKTAISTFVKSAMVAGVSGSILIPNKALSGPEGGVISQGSGSISVDNKTTTIQQSSNAMVVDWQSFNVAQDELVKFEHPSAKASTLNRIHDQNPSQILGRVEGQGNVFLINPNGIVFGENSTVNLGSLVATTKQISDNDFMSGNIVLQDVDGEGVIVNKGTLTAATGGSVVLVGDNVVNEGVIQAVKGIVVLASGESATLDFDGDGLLQFKLSGEVTEGETDTAVLNSGLISADDGSVILTAKAARDVFANVVNNTGVIEAKGIDTSGGKIRLIGEGADVRNSGQLIATSEQGTGGQIDVTGARVAIDDGALLDVSGKNGGGSIRVGGGYQGNDADLNNAEQTYIAETAELKADAIDSGDGGQVIVWADEYTNYQGSISAKGGAQSGDGGFAEVSGKQTLNFTGDVDLTAENGVTGELLIDPENIRIVANGGNHDIDENDEFDENDDDTAKFDASDIVDLLETTNVTLQATNDITVEADLDATANSGDVSTTNNLSLHAHNEISIDGEVSLKSGATLTLIADGIDGGNGNITQSEAITVTNLVVDVENSANLTDLSNDFDTVSVLGDSVNIRDVDGVELAGANLTGSLTVNAGGNITQSAVLEVVGATSLTATGANITLENSNNDFSSLSLSAVNADIEDKNALELGASNLTGTFSVTSEGNITQTAALDVDGAASFTSNAGDITLENTANDFSSVSASATNLSLRDANDLSVAGLNATDLTITSIGNLTQTGAFTVTNNATIDAASATLAQNNNFNTLSLAGGSAMVTDSNAVDLGATDLTGALTVTASGDITQSGSIDVDGTTTLTATGADITLDNSNNNFNSLALNAVNATIEDKNALALAASTLTGDLDVTADDDITQSGAVTVVGNAGFTSTTASITLDDSSNDFNSLELSAINSTIKESNALELGESSLTGSLNVTSGGNLTQSGAIDVDGATILAVTGDITLENATNDFATLSATATNLAVRDSNDLSVAALNVSDLTITTAGALNQSGAFVVANNADINAATATLTEANNFNTLSLNGGSANVNDIDGIVLGSSDLTGALTVTAAGNITQSGAIEVDGATSLTATGADITLDNSANNFTSLALSAVNAVIKDSNALELAASAITNTLNITSGGNLTQFGAIDVNGATVLAVTGDITLDNAANDLTSLDVTASTSTNLSVADTNDLSVSAVNVDDLSLTTGGVLTQTGAFVVANNAEIDAATATLTQNNNFNNLALNGGSAEVIDLNAVELGASDLTGNLTITAEGDITQSDAVEVDGTTSLTATGADINLNNAANDLNTLTATAINITVRDTNDLSVAGLNTTDLTVTTGGALTQTGAFIVSDEATFNTSLATLSQDNDFNTLLLSGGSITVNDLDDVVLGASNLTGALTVTAAGNITQSAALDIDGAASFTATGANITLSNSANDFVSLALNGVNATVQGSNALELSTSSISNTLNITTGGHLTQSGAIDVDGAAVLNVAGDITLTNAANDFNTLDTTSNNLSVSDANDLSLAGLSVDDLEITTVGNLIQTGIFTVSNTASIDAATATLTQNNNFNTLSLTGGTVTVNDINNLEFGRSNLIGTLTATAGGYITQSGSIDVDGVTTLIATGADITLDNSNNDFASLALNAANATIEDKNALALAVSTLTGDLDITADDDITQSGAVTVIGIASFTSTTASITLDNASNDFKSLALSGNNATVQESNTLELATSSLTGSLNVTSGGNLTQSGAIDVDGATILAVTGDITLENAANDFATLNVTASNLAVRDSNDLSVAALNVSDLTITTTGALNQSGAFVVANNADINAATATLTQANNFNTLSLNGGSANVNDIDGILLDSSDLTGALTVTAAGNITQSGAIEVDGAASFTAAGADITLNNSANNFVSLALTAVNAVIEDSNALELVASAITNTLNITSGGNLTQSDAIDVDGATVLAVTGDITLDNAANDLTSLDVTASTSSSMSVTDTNDLSVSAVNVDNLSLTTGGVLTQTGAFVVANNAEIDAATATLTQNNNFNNLALNGGSAEVIDINAVELGASDLTGNLTITAAGDITQSDAVEVNGATALTATGADINLNNAANDLNSLTAVASNTSVRDTNDLSVADLSTTDLAITTGGALTQTGAFIVSGEATFNSASATLTQSNDFNTLLLSGGSSTVNDINDLDLGLSSLTGNLTITATGDVGQIAGVVVAGDTDITVGTTIDLQHADNDFNRFNASATELYLRDSNSLSISALNLDDLSLRTGAILVQTGTIIVANHTDINAANTDLNLANDFNTLSINGGNVSVNDINQFDLATSSLSGTASITVNGALSQSGGLTADHVEINATGQNVQLDHAGNAFNSVSAVAENLTATNGSDLVIADMTIGQKLTVTAAGNVTQTAAISVADVEINAVGFDVTLTDVNNDFDTLAISAANAEVIDLDGLALASGQITNHYDLTVNGDVTQTSAINAGLLGINATGHSIQLDQSANQLSAISLQAADATIGSTGNMTVESSSLTNMLSLIISGDITQGGPLLVPDLFVNTGANNLTLSDAGNQLDQVTVTANQATIRDQGDLELLDIDATHFGVEIDGALTQSVATSIVVADTLSVNANNIVLNEANQINSAELLGGGNAELTNSLSLELQDVALTNLTLDVNGSVSNTTASSINVNNDFVVSNNGNINLGAVSGDSVNFGSITLDSNNVTIHENSHTLLKDSTASNLTLQSTGDVRDQGDLSVSGTLTVDAQGDIELGTLGSSEVTRFGAISLKGANIRVVEEDSMMINRAEGDVVELISETGGINTNGTQIQAQSALTLDAGPNQDIGSPSNLIDFTLERTGSLTLDARNAYLTQSAADFSKQVALFNSNALIRSEANLTALTRSEVQFLSYLLGVDDALFNEFVTIFDVQEDGMLLPEDQREEELSWLSNDGRYLVSVDRNERFEYLHEMWVKYGEIFTVLAMNSPEQNVGLM